MKYKYSIVLDKIIKSNELISTRSREYITIINSNKMRFILRIICLI